MHFFSRVLFGIGIFLVFALGFWVWSSQTSVDRISINGTELTVRVAERPFAVRNGLSGYSREDLREDGMLFVFSDAQVREFWMKDMEFALDILWIADGRIVAIDRDVPPPSARFDEPARVSSLPLRVDAVLELPAGQAYEFGIIEGMSMKFLE